MILTDYFCSKRDVTWDYAVQCGVTHGVIRLPETEAFDMGNFKHWEQIYHAFMEFGIRPVVIEPMPNRVHHHIKVGDERRDESIEQVIGMFPIMEQLGIQTICFNFMAYIGWLRTNQEIKERGGALVTGFDLQEFVPTGDEITERQLWDNYAYFIKAVIPFAEKHSINLALHPDDPPVAQLGGVSRIMISLQNIKHALEIVKSERLGVTMCQATYLMMDENLYQVIPELAKKIFFVHFRNATGNRYRFRETFHDNGDIDMADILRLYQICGVDVPIRVDHVPSMTGDTKMDGYAPLGRLYALGYLKGLLDGIK